MNAAINGLGRIGRADMKQILPEKRLILCISLAVQFRQIRRFRRILRFVNLGGEAISRSMYWP